MKKVYETPVAEKIEFCYRDQVVASGGSGCIKVWFFVGDNYCADGNKQEGTMYN